MILPSHKRQRKPVKLCILRCQQGFLLSIIAIGIIVLILIVVTPLPLMLEDFVSKLSSDDYMLNLVEERKESLNPAQCTFGNTLCLPFKINLSLKLDF